MKHFFISSTLGLLLAISATCSLADEAVAARAILGGTPFANTNYGVNVVNGLAILASTDGGGSTNVIVQMTGLKPGTTHIGHIHAGVCPQLFPGTILYTLTPVTANASGEGTSQTQIYTGMQGLADCSWWVAVHEGPENASPQTPAVAVGPVIFHGASR